MDSKTISFMTKQDIEEREYLQYTAFIYRGTIKSRKKDFIKKVVNHCIVNFENDTHIWEIIRMLDGNYAVRCFNKNSNKYVRYSPLVPGMFFR